MTFCLPSQIKQNITHPGYHLNRNLNGNIHGIQVHILLESTFGIFADLPNLENKTHCAQWLPYACNQLLIK